jgi:hypothetical protein
MKDSVQRMKGVMLESKPPQNHIEEIMRMHYKDDANDLEVTTKWIIVLNYMMTAN